MRPELRHHDYDDRPPTADSSNSARLCQTIIIVPRHRREQNWKTPRSALYALLRNSARNIAQKSYPENGERQKITLLTLRALLANMQFSRSTLGWQHSNPQMPHLAPQPPQRQHITQTQHAERQKTYCLEPLRRHRLRFCTTKAYGATCADRCR